MSTKPTTYASAVVTGASSGIGRALAVALGAGGAHVVLVARRRELLESAAREVERAGGSAEVLVQDVADTTATVRALRAADARRPLDLVVANAGAGARRGLDPSSWEAVADACHVNYCGAAATLTAVLPAMVARGRGHLVGIGSLASYGALPFSAAYCAPKAGLAMLLECLRLDTLGTGVGVTHVRLGFVRTSMVAGSTHPMPQLVEAAEAARHVVGRLAGAPATITFPRALAAATRAAATLPRPVRDLVARRAGARYR